MAHLRLKGYRPEKVEYWNPHVARKDGGKGIRVDLYGIIDVVAVPDLSLPNHPNDKGVLGVQSTTVNNIASHLKTAAESPALIDWLAAGNRFVIHGWHKVGRYWHMVEREIKEIKINTLAPAQLRKPDSGDFLGKQGESTPGASANSGASDD